MVTNSVVTQITGQAYAVEPAVLWVLCLESRTLLEQTGGHVTSRVSTLQTGERN